MSCSLQLLYSLSNSWGWIWTHVWLLLNPTKCFVYIMVSLSLIHLLGSQSMLANLDEPSIGLTLQPELPSGFCFFTFVSSIRTTRSIRTETISHFLTFESPVPNKLPGIDKVFSKDYWNEWPQGDLGYLRDAEHMKTELFLKGQSWSQISFSSSYPGFLICLLLYSPCILNKSARESIPALLST